MWECPLHYSYLINALALFKELKYYTHKRLPLYEACYVSETRPYNQVVRFF